MKTISRTYFYQGLTIVVLCTVFFTASLVHAQNQNATTGMPNRDEMREARQMQISENVQNRLINLVDNITRRIIATEVRFENIIARLDSRIAKLETEGVDTVATKERLNATKNSLENVKNSIKNLSSAARAITSEKPREAMAQIRTDLRTIQSQLRETHQGLIATVALLKEAIQNADVERGVSSAVTDSPSDNVSPE